MTGCRVAYSVFLALGFTVAVSAAGQPPEEGIAVRSVEEVGNLERLEMAVKRALIPGVRVFYPLYAYDRDLVCDEDQSELLIDHDGPAAIITRRNGVAIAYYRRSVDEALATVERDGWCDRSGEEWQVATVYPLGGDLQEQERYLSREVGRIEALLHTSRE